MIRAFRFLCALLALCFACCSALTDAFSDSPARAEAACRSLLRLEALTTHDDVVGISAGVVLFDSQTVVADIGILRDAQYIASYDESGARRYLFDALSWDAQSGLALLRFSDPTDLVPLDDDTQSDLSRLSPVVALCQSEDGRNAAYKGYVTSLFEQDGVPYIGFCAPLPEHHLGGALLDEQGNVVGIFRPSQGGAGTDNAVRIDALAALYSSDAPLCAVYETGLFSEPNGQPSGLTVYAQAAQGNQAAGAMRIGMSLPDQYACPAWKPGVLTYRGAHVFGILLQ